MPKKIAFKTLGCRLNQYETDSLVSQFVENGYQVVDFEAKADAYIVNSCTVTNQSDKRSRGAYNQALRTNPDSLLLLTGCMATHYKDKLRLDDNITYVVDNEHKSSVFTIIDAHFKGEITQPDDFQKDVFGFAPARDTLHTRSMIKIQDGCDNFCTFCIVPHVRGRAISREPKDVLENIRQVLDYGFHEIVLTGVNITRYEHLGIRFDDLLEQVLELEGDFRVRISSIEPEGFGDKFFDLLQHPRMTPHLHMCLQSGSDKVLLQMRRMYTLSAYRKIVERLRYTIPALNLTTDIIVGFPSETDDDFNLTLDRIREFGFSHIHTFKYSRREGTRAARMTDQIHERLKTDRSEQVRMLAEENKRIYRSHFIGSTQKVLIERIENGMANGYGQHYIPVIMPAENLSRNQFVNAQLLDIELCEDPQLIGKVFL